MVAKGTRDAKVTKDTHRHSSREKYDIQHVDPIPVTPFATFVTLTPFYIE